MKETENEENKKRKEGIRWGLECFILICLRVQNTGVQKEERKEMK